MYDPIKKHQLRPSVSGGRLVVASALTCPRKYSAPCHSTVSMCQPHVALIAQSWRTWMGWPSVPPYA